MQVNVLVIDSFGIGALPDAGEYGDSGSNTALHICESIKGNKWANLRNLGLGNCAELLGFSLPGCEALEKPLASFGVMEERSPGKDTTTGHWELAGIELDAPFHIFPSEYPSFPDALIKAFKAETKRSVLGNRAASGTVIIQELGAEHLATGSPIVYTSGDSVFQIAAHEEVIAVEEVYEMCVVARRLCDPYRVGRVIARPFVGKSGNFTRTSGRRDFSMPPPEDTLLDYLQAAGVDTVGIGKIGDIFCEQGLTQSHHDVGNRACLERTFSLLAEETSNSRFVFVNLVDTDMVYGHRRDVQGYFDAVSEIDDALGVLMNQMPEGDILIVTADHGCDPTFRGTDHTREHVPLLWFEKGRSGKNVGVRKSFSDLAQSIAEFYGIKAIARGVSWKQRH